MHEEQRIKTLVNKEGIQVSVKRFHEIVRATITHTLKTEGARVVYTANALSHNDSFDVGSHIGQVVDGKLELEKPRIEFLEVPEDLVKSLKRAAKKYKDVLLKPAVA